MMQKNPKKESKFELFGLEFFRHGGNVYLRFENPMTLRGNWYDSRTYYHHYQRNDKTVGNRTKRVTKRIGDLQ